MKKIFSWKKLLLFCGAIFILFIGIAIGSGLKEEPPVPSGNLTISLAEVAKDGVNENKNENDNIAVKESEVGDKLVKVVRAVDGDTIEIEGGGHVRYIGIDTPETVDPRKPVQCFGVEASAKNKELVENKMVRLEKDVTDKDKYDRLLRYVYVGDSFINLELVKQGFAYSYSYPPDIKYQDQFVKAQQEAREAKRGLWNACLDDSRVNPSSVAPTTAPAPAAQSASGSCVIKGNISTSGEKSIICLAAVRIQKRKLMKAMASDGFVLNPRLKLPAGARR